MRCSACAVSVLEAFLRGAIGPEIRSTGLLSRVPKALTARVRSFSTRSTRSLPSSTAARALNAHYSEPPASNGVFHPTYPARRIPDPETASPQSNERTIRGNKRVDETTAASEEDWNTTSGRAQEELDGSVLELNDENIRAILETAATKQTKIPYRNSNPEDPKQEQHTRYVHQEPGGHIISKVEGALRLHPDGRPGPHEQAAKNRYRRADTVAPDAVKPVRKGRAATKTPFGQAREVWQVQKDALTNKFSEEGWKPRKRLSPDALEGIRALHAQDPNKFTTPFLADQFQVSAEAVRRILKSKWRPSEEEQEDRRRRWDKRGEKIWTKMVELGAKPPKKWREMGVGMPQWKLDKDAKRRDSRRNKEPRGGVHIEVEEPEPELDVGVSKRIL